jgi:hypothetical protein
MMNQQHIDWATREFDAKLGEYHIEAASDASAGGSRRL